MHGIPTPTREALLRALHRAGLDLADMPPEPEYGGLAWLIWADGVLFTASRPRRSMPQDR